MPDGVYLPEDTLKVDPKVPTASPARPDPMWDNLVRQASGIQQEGKDISAQLRESSAKKREIADLVTLNKPPAPPEIEKPEKPNITPPNTDPVQSFGSFASTLGIFGSLLTRRPLTSALNASSAAMKAFRQRDLEKFETELQTWKVNSKYAADLAQWQMQRYEQARGQHKDNHDQLMSAFNMIAASDQDKVMQHAISTGDFSVVEKAYHDKQTMLQNYNQSSLQLAQFAETQRHHLALERENSGANKWQIVTDPATNQQYRYNPQTARYTNLAGEPMDSPPTGATKGTGAMGNRESVFTQRVVQAANQATKDLENVAQLPTTASSGWFGSRKPGPGLMDATREVLANTATSQEAQSYNAMSAGFQRTLAAIETSGLAPSGSLTHQMDAVIFKEGDTNLTKLHKLAQTRQIIESGMEVLEANPRVSPSEKEKIKEIAEKVRAAVPYTHSDLIRLTAEQEKNPKATLRDIMPGAYGSPDAVLKALDEGKLTADEAKKQLIDRFGYKPTEEQQ